MDLNPGDSVVHRSFGVGTLSSIDEMDYAGKGARLFYRVDFIGTTVWIPIETGQAGGIRPLTPKSDLDIYRDVLKSAPEPLADQFQKRQIHLERYKAVGTFRALCELVRNLSARSWKKPLTGLDKNLLRQARVSLVQEWARTSEITQTEASDEIEDCLQIGRQTFSGI